MVLFTILLNMGIIFKMFYRECEGNEKRHKTIWRQFETIKLKSKTTRQRTPHHFGQLREITILKTYK